jgi:hypothetical protein
MLAAVVRQESLTSKVNQTHTIDVTLTVVTILLPFSPLPPARSPLSDLLDHPDVPYLCNSLFESSSPRDAE